MSTTIKHTYASAIETLKARKGEAGTLSWDAGEGWRSEVYWCASRKRVVVTAINPRGERVVSS